MNWSKKSAAEALRKGTHSRHFLAEKIGMSPSALYYFAFPNRLKKEKSRAKAAKKKNGKGRKTKKSAKKEAPVTLTATIKREIREQVQRSASALASLIVAQTA